MNGEYVLFFSLLLLLFSFKGFERRRLEGFYIYQVKCSMSLVMKFCVGFKSNAYTRILETLKVCRQIDKDNDRQADRQRHRQTNTQVDREREIGNAAGR